MVRRIVCLALAAALLAGLMSATAQTTRPASRPTSAPAQPTSMSIHWLKEAEAEVARIQDPRRRASLGAFLAMRYAQRGQISKAKDVLQQLPEDHRDIYVPFAALAVARTGGHDAAVDLASRIDDTWTKIDCLCDIFAEEKSPDFAPLVKMAEAITDDFDRTHALSQIAEKQAELGDIEGARQTAAKLPAEQNDGRRPNLIERSFVESTIKAAEIVHAGKNIRAALAEEGVELKRVHFLIRQVIRQRLDKGRIAAAAELAEQLGDPEDRAGAFLEIAKAQVEAGEKDAARKSLAKALADAERIAAYRAKQDAAAGPEGPDTRYRSRLDSVMSRTYWAAVSIRAKLRDLDAARKLILKAANSKLKPADWDRALDEPEVRTGWSSALVEAGREDEALKLAKGADGKWRPKMRVLVAWLLASRGQTKQIEQLIADVKDPEKRVRMMLSASRGAAEREKGLAEQAKAKKKTPTTQETK